MGLPENDPLQGQSVHFGRWYSAPNTAGIMYILFLIMTSLVIVACGARAQNRRYERREKDFQKVLKYLNYHVFSEKGVEFVSGRFGAYIQLNLKPKSKRE